MKFLLKILVLACFCAWTTYALADPRTDISSCESSGGTCYGNFYWYSQDTTPDEQVKPSPLGKYTVGIGYLLTLDSSGNTWGNAPNQSTKTNTINCKGMTYGECRQAWVEKNGSSFNAAFTTTQAGIYSIKCIYLLIGVDDERYSTVFPGSTCGVPVPSTLTCKSDSALDINFGTVTASGYDGTSKPATPVLKIHCDDKATIAVRTTTGWTVDLSNGTTASLKVGELTNDGILSTLGDGGGDLNIPVVATLHSVGNVEPGPFSGTAGLVIDYF